MYQITILDSPVSKNPRYNSKLKLMSKLESSVHNKYNNKHHHYSSSKLSSYFKKLDSGPKFDPKKTNIKLLNNSGNISSRKQTQDIPHIDTNTSVQYSTVELFKEEDSTDFMFSLPIDECFDLINYEPKSSIDPLAQAIPSLNTKSKQIPKEETKGQKKSISSEKDLLSKRMASYSSFKKKHSNQVGRGKLSNYIDAKV
jgi:hypothetical protein